MSYDGSRREESLAFLLSDGWEGKRTIYGPCEGFVYLIATTGGEVPHGKIGFTRGDPRLRLAAIQTGNHRHLQLWTFFPACRETERQLHRHFAANRASGEWFRFPPEEATSFKDRMVEIIEGGRFQ